MIRSYFFAQVIIAISFIIICFDGKNKDFRLLEKSPTANRFFGCSGAFKGRISISLFFFCIIEQGNFDDTVILP